MAEYFKTAFWRKSPVCVNRKLQALRIIHQFVTIQYKRTQGCTKFPKSRLKVVGARLETRTKFDT